jgi:hypothetical protein
MLLVFQERHPSFFCIPGMDIAHRWFGKSMQMVLPVDGISARINIDEL